MSSMNIETSVELKACPFCGGEAQMHYYGSKGRKIKCASCLIQYKQRVIFKSVEWLEEELIKDWNTRI